MCLHMTDVRRLQPLQPLFIICFCNLIMNYNRYHWCVVSNCKSTSVRNPHKLFIKVPDDLKMRNMWLELAKRDPKSLSTKSRLHLCEDHFNLEEDMQNYMEYKIMGSIKQVKIKAGTIPSKFYYHSERKHKLTASTSQSTPSNTQSLDLVEDAGSSILVKDIIESATSSQSDFTIFDSEKNKADKATQVQILTIDKSVQAQVISQESKSIQANITARYRSKSTQSKIIIRDQCLSPIKTSVSIATSPHIKGSQIDKPSRSGVTRSARRKISVIFEEKSDSKLSLTPSVSSEWSFLSKSKTTSEGSSPEELKLEDQKLYYLNTLSKIKKNSRLYLSTPKEFYFLIDIITLLFILVYK